MNQSTLGNAANTAARKSKNLLVQQIDRQANALGKTVEQTAHDLEHIGSQLRESGTIGGAAQLADWAARYVSTAATYLQQGNTDRFIADLETLGRERPWAITATAAAAGFIAARVIKSSSARRLKDGYVESYGNDYAFASDAIAPATAAETY